MIEHFSIRPRIKAPDFIERVLEQAAMNPRSFVIDDSPQRKTVCFCSTPESAQHWKTNASQVCSLSAAIAYFTLTPEGILREPESGHAETLSQLTEIIRWVLQAFPDYSVIDEETGKDVTSLVKINPDILSIPNWELLKP